MKGFEPSTSGWKPEMLPLHHTCILWDWMDSNHHCTRFKRVASCRCATAPQDAGENRTHIARFAIACFHPLSYYVTVHLTGFEPALELF